MIGAGKEPETVNQGRELKKIERGTREEGTEIKKNVTALEGML